MGNEIGPVLSNQPDDPEGKSRESDLPGDDA